MQVETQFSVFLANKPGMLAQVCRALGQAKVNIRALTVMDSSEHGVLRLVLDNPEEGRRVLTALNVPMTETEVLSVEMPNRPGALADVCDRLAQEHINIVYAYGSGGGRGGKAIGVFKVPDVKKAIHVLSDRRPKRRDITTTLRRPSPLRRS